MKVLLVTTWDIPCGIAEHAFYLKEAVEAADPTIQIDPAPLGIAPGPDWEAIANRIRRTDLVHLNYQAALLSQWTPERLAWIHALGKKVVVTWHDSGVPNSDQCQALNSVADAMILHEPFDDLPVEKTFYWRMGVPDWPGAYQFADGGRPLLGSIGFPSGHKNYTELARLTGALGWGLLLIAPGATPDQQWEWRDLNPHLRIETAFLDRRRALSLLAGCDATCFAYVTNNAGQSGPILQGIATRKPVIALSTCRMFRALLQDDLASHVIYWPQTFEQIADCLKHLPIQRVDPGIVALAEQESWLKVGQKYARLYQDLIG